MYRIILAISTLPILGCSNDTHQDLLGYWKSNEQKTLESMRNTPGITEEAKEMFTGNFFGKLVIEYKKDTYRALYENEEENPKEFYQYQPYKVLKVTNEYYLTESYSDLLEEIEIKKLYKEGDCYYVFTSKWNFKEYFCREQ